MRSIDVIPAEAGIQKPTWRSIDVIPASPKSRGLKKAGIQKPARRNIDVTPATARIAHPAWYWMPAFAGMTAWLDVAAAAPAPASTAAAAPSLAGGAIEMMLSLMLVLGLLFTLAWLLKRMQMQRGSRAGAMTVHAGLPLGGKEKVVWLEAGGKHFLLGVTPQAISLIHTYEQAPALPEAAPLPPLASAFAQKLNEALGRKAP